MNARVFGNDEGETVVLAHGYGGTRFIWEDVVPALAARFRVVVFDWSFSGAAKDGGQGYCCSYYGLADELVALMDKLGVQRAAFVGHSMAGMIGCIASIARPDLFSHLVLVGASPRYINEDGYEGGFEPGDVDAMLATADADFAAWAPRFAEAVVGAEHPSAVARFAKQLGAMRPDVALCVLRAVLTSDVRAVLPDVAARCTIVHCAHDAVAPLAVARYMQRAMAGSGDGGADTVVIESSGHFPQLTAPKEFVRVLEAILLDH
ncbi:Strigolactone esterase D14 [Dichanthelium oligosanthes]|uniref:Strigolactone esterase D14 n=1 Tax=Dichanthelium oligosanthes TaxID=888268 RepID=A0A1E5UPC2_9POAL|nr:Strigolactone esterase D14 [Dichanthelium oligosanthes]